MVQSRLNFYKFHKLKTSNHFCLKSLDFKHSIIFNGNYNFFYFNNTSDYNLDYLNFKKHKNTVKKIKIKKICNSNNTYSIFSF